jgi:hypothetical protein
MNAADFRAAMAALPEPPDIGQPPHWSFWRRQLWQLGQAEDVANFWKWPAVYHTMLVNHFPIGHQLAYLQEDWDRWLPVVGHAGNEANYRNLVNQAYHLRKWEQATGRRIEQLDSILEFGGGYGAMALVCRRLGFAGRYLIHDLPEFALLQRYWTGQQHIHVEHIVAPTRVDLVIGIYSLSEIPVSDRQRWVEVADAYLLLYSGEWAGIDNHAWVREVVGANDGLLWSVSQFPDRPDWYAIGWPKA